MMKIILSRKGFDAQNGGTASPILSDGTMLSFPIPQYDGVFYKDIFYNSKSYMEMWQELKPRQRDFDEECHLDPDIRPQVRKRLPKNWVPIFGQAGAAESHLENQGVGEGDLFMFFGWFRETEEKNGSLCYKKGGRDIHALYGYLQIGSIVRGRGVKKYKWHPHAYYEGSDNTMYIASDRLVIEGDDTGLPGYGVFKFSDKVQLTMPGQSRSRWLLPDFFKKVTISRHDKDCFRPEGYFQTVGIGQEFVVSENSKVTKWAYDIIRENIDYRNYSNESEIKPGKRTKQDKKTYLYVYRMTNDTGLAPCVKDGILSLACCKGGRICSDKIINTGLRYWIGSKHNGVDYTRDKVYISGTLDGKMVYLARVTSVVTMEEYYSRMSQGRTDDIYDVKKGKISRNKWLYKEGIHIDKKDILRDIAGKYVLLSDDYIYLGKDAASLDIIRNYNATAREIKTYTAEIADKIIKACYKTQDGKEHLPTDP